MLPELYKFSSKEHPCLLSPCWKHFHNLEDCWWTKVRAYIACCWRSSMWLSLDCSSREWLHNLSTWKRIHTPEKCSIELLSVKMFSKKPYQTMPFNNHHKYWDLVEEFWLMRLLNDVVYGWHWPHISFDVKRFQMDLIFTSFMNAFMVKLLLVQTIMVSAL